jgi:hypothetical protein
MWKIASLGGQMAGYSGNLTYLIEAIKKPFNKITLLN